VYRDKPTDFGQGIQGSEEAQFNIISLDNNIISNNDSAGNIYRPSGKRTAGGPQVPNARDNFFTGKE
jgi:hypothetical protein